MSDTLEPIWQEYHTQLHRFILNRVNNTSIADDILQDVFLKIHSRINTLKAQTKLKSWIYQITRHAIIDHYRTQKKWEPLSDKLVAPEREPSERAREEIENCLLSLLQNLPDNYRQALIWSEIDGLKQIEVADKLGLSWSGAKSRIQRGRAMIKERLLKCCQFEFDHRGTLIDYELKKKLC